MTKLYFALSLITMAVITTIVCLIIELKELKEVAKEYWEERKKQND